MSIINNQFSLILEFNMSIDSKYGKSSLEARTIKNNLWVTIILYIFEYAPLLSGFGAMCYAMTSIISADVLSILINRNLIIFFNLIIGLCGAIVIGEWIFIDKLIAVMIPFAKILAGIP